MCIKNNLNFNVDILNKEIIFLYTKISILTLQYLSNLYGLYEIENTYCLQDKGKESYVIFSVLPGNVK